MRFTTLVLLLAACDPGCDPPGTLDGATYRTFGNLVQYQLGGPEPYPGFSPINGVTTWGFDWGTQLEGPITVTIDGQPFEGTGVWGDFECNTFTAQFAGRWVAPGGRAHEFDAAGNFFYYDVLIEGSLAWSESWNDGGITGTMSSNDAAISGRMFAP